MLHFLSFKIYHYAKIPKTIQSLLLVNSFFVNLQKLVVMNSSFYKILVFLVVLGANLELSAQDCEPYGIYVDDNGTSNTINSAQGFSGSAPITVNFFANPTTTIENGVHFEWHFLEQSDKRQSFLIRYEENTDYTFKKAGSFLVCLYELSGNDTLNIYDPIMISISESELVMPNAFSPNGDGINDIYKVKSGFKSIVEFHAVIFNRWGQKLFEWTNPNEGWDGTYKGKNVAQGVYFVNVKAKGADGREFHIKRDVNLLRGFSETTRGNN